MIKCLNLVQVICDDCGETVILKTWQSAKLLGWVVPNDGALQRCPLCSKKYIQNYLGKFRRNKND